MLGALLARPTVRLNTRLTAPVPGTSTRGGTGFRFNMLKSLLSTQLTILLHEGEFKSI